MLILDTNIVSELLKATPKVVAKFEAVEDSERISTTTITRFEILMRGRYQAVLVAADGEQLLMAYSRLIADEERLGELEILQITHGVADQFDMLLKRKKLGKIGRADLLIACICLAHDATLVTRNIKDFKNIPNLRLENWAD